MWNTATELTLRLRACRLVRFSSVFAPATEKPSAARVLTGILLATVLQFTASPGFAADDASGAAQSATMLTVSSSTGRPSSIDLTLVAKLADTMAAEHDQADRFHAQVWLAASEQRLTRYLKSREERLALLKTIYREANRQHLDPDLVLAVMQIESAFDRYAISRVGAQGLMQVMPFWRLEIGRPQDNLTEMATNVRYGTTILAHYMDIAENDLVDALGRYNGSRGRLIYPEKVMTAWRQRWRNKSASELPVLLTTCARYQLIACRYN
jgi:soluble lytic murein transglycosylase-like protein